MAPIRILCNCSIVHIPEAKQSLESVGEVTYAEYKYPRLLGRPVCLRFRLKQARLFAFQIAKGEE